ncbi:hypothetical protein J6590_006813 [Homalodisca vitripennis]|nr:hypothetical protein J6590_006813 [Homalodisca vitripennis]
MSQHRHWALWYLIVVTSPQVTPPRPVNAAASVRDCLFGIVPYSQLSTISDGRIAIRHLRPAQ